MAAPTAIFLAAVCGMAWAAVTDGDVGGHSSGGETGGTIRLPRPRTDGVMSLAEALQRRRSVREFSGKPLSLEQVSQLCWAAQGVTDEPQGYRTAPSAGALFPVHVYVVDPKGVYRYEPAGHVLRPALTGDVRGKLRAATLDQPCVGEAPLCLVLTIDVARTATKYGRRAERYCLLEAGHIAQNVLLQATALGLAGVPVGAFEDRRVASVLALPDRFRPVYLLPVGHPRSR